MILPFDLTEVLLNELRRNRRPNDGLLHASSHLLGSLRHAQLDVAGAPKVESELLSEITLMTGTMWHEYLHNALRQQGVPYMAEVNLTPWMPYGWGGTADGLFLNPELKAFVLADFKTTKGEGMRFIEKDGAKNEHIWQASIYWYAARAMLMGTARIANAIGVYYLPKNDTRGKDDVIEPLLVEFEPVPYDELMAVADERHKTTSEYIASLPDLSEWNPHPPAEVFVTDELAPVQDRVQVLTRQGEVLLKPHWSAAYCPYPEELCDCNKQGQTKIGEYDEDGHYMPREGYENIEPEVTP